MRGVWNNFAPGVLLVVTNAAPGNPTQVWMEYGGEWYLNYKNETTMYDLGSSLDGVAEMNVVVDSFGVYQFLEIRKK